MKNSDQDRSTERKKGKTPIRVDSWPKTILLGLVELWFPRYAFKTGPTAERRIFIGAAVFVGIALGIIAIGAGNTMTGIALMCSFGLLAIVMAFFNRRIAARKVTSDGHNRDGKYSADHE